MASIFEEGLLGQMSVCIPEISSVSWSSFMTGTQPGVHGIYGFIELEPRSYKMCFPNFGWKIDSNMQIKAEPQTDLS